MGCATGLVKNLVFLLNFLCSIVGLVLIIIGSIALAAVNKIDVATKQSNGFAPAFILSLGVLIFFISFLGCCGVCQRSQCMLITYAVILIIFFVTQLALGIYGYIQISGNQATVKNEMHKALEDYFSGYNKNESVKVFYDEFQRDLKCCGVNGPNDYINPHLLVDPTDKYPGSCCDKPDNEKCDSQHTPYQEGCADKLYDLVIHYLKIVSYVALGICVTEIVSALFAICLVNSYRNESRRGM